MKAALIRFGIRNFKPTLRKAQERVADLRTAEETPLPAETLAELRRDMARLRLVREQIKAIETARLRRLEQARTQSEGPPAMVRLLARVLGIGVETADMLVSEVLARNLRDRERLRAMPGSPARRMKAASGGGRRAGAGRQRTGAARHDPARLALPDLPEGQRLGAMVSGANRGRTRRHAQDDDRGLGPQAAHRAVAHGHDG